MTPSYDSSLSLVTLIDSKMDTLGQSIQKERRDKEQLSDMISRTKSHISTLKGALYALSTKPDSASPYAETDSLIDKEWEKVRKRKTTADYVADAKVLAAINFSTEQCGIRLKGEPSIDEVQMEYAAGKRNFGTWIKRDEVYFYVASIRKTLAYLKGYMNKPELTEIDEKRIDSSISMLSGLSLPDNYFKNAEQLVSLYYSTATHAEAHEREKKQLDLILQQIKGHKNYRTWVKNADKLSFPVVAGAMPEKLTDYSSEAINLLIDYGAKVLWEPYKRYMFYYFYTLYKNAVKEAKSNEELIQHYHEIHEQAKGLIEKWILDLSNALETTIQHISSERVHITRKFDSVNTESTTLIKKWIDALVAEKKEYEGKLANLETEYAAFDKKSDVRLKALSSRLEGEVYKAHVPNTYNTFIREVESKDVPWRKVTSKEQVVTAAKEDFVLTYLNNKGRTRISDNVYYKALADRMVSSYSTLLSIVNNQIHVRFPLQMHLDTLNYRMAVNISDASTSARTAINGCVQRMVASVIANMPVGKVKLIFGDPSNTGVFSNFRDVGKNDSEGSRLCTYIVDVKNINIELERLSNEIGYTINNILKGTKTTLFQHNKERAFNSSPYEFLFLMDYPQNMTAQSLQALKNIVENGPKCGIFTFIFNVAGTSLKLLKADEQTLAREIAPDTFVWKNGNLCDSKGSWLDSEKEISTTLFDGYVKHYNEAIKDAKQLTVQLDELDGSVNTKGEFKIPIGKNLGGETEYMSFFGSCQDYLVSGATRMGKTNALHVMIYNTLKYVPDAELYLVDFKQGVEFAPYAGLNHPSIKALAVESVPEFGYAVLKHIEEKIKTISELFISYSVKNWKEYYEATGKVIPVTIVILDEFQHLYDTDVGKDCTRIIEVIAKEGGAFNVHIILATQSMNNVTSLSNTAKDNIFGRMVFHHSKQEYNSMLWDDPHLAMTLSDSVKGQMVFATGDKNSQRLIQWAIAKPVSTVVDELSYPISDGRYQTKLLLSTIKENPFSVFNAIINHKYKVNNPEICEITLGNEVNVFAGDLRKQLATGDKAKTVDFVEKSYLQLTNKPNENLLFVGNNEELAESSFQLSLYCALAKQISLNRKNSIVLIAPEISTRLTAIADAFPDYIQKFGQEDDLSEIDLNGKEFMFVFGLQNFRSMGYQADAQLITARTDNVRSRTSNHLMSRPAVSRSQLTDGQILQNAVESNDIHVVAWHNSMEYLTTMFGGPARIQDFLYKFIHKIGFKMSDKKDSYTLVNSESCVNLSSQAAVYVKMNRERIIRPYKAMPDEYCATLNQALKELEKET